MRKRNLILMLSISTIGIMTLKPMATKADSKVELTAGVTSYLNSVMLGRVRYGDYTYTWYSQRVLPGGGLNIPGRHLNEYGLVADENEYVVIASDDLPHGTIVNTPIGIQGIVYDEGSGNGNLDIYCDW